VSIVIDDELHTITNSLEMMHLGHSVDMMRKSKKVFETAKTGWDKELVNRCVVSSILHGFCALESVINLFGNEMFFHQDSKRYIPPEKRGFLLKKFIETWNKAPSIEKLRVILAHSGNSELSALPAKLDNELRELNNLRNWIAHGFIYTTTFLLEPTEGGNTEQDQSYTIHDMEDSVNWQRKFPNTKFKSLKELNYEDAQIALTIVLKTLKIISENFSLPFHLITCEYPPNYKLLWKKTFNRLCLIQEERSDWQKRADVE
jgi:hypothetical protein